MIKRFTSFSILICYCSITHYFLIVDLFWNYCAITTNDSLNFYFFYICLFIYDHHLMMIYWVTNVFWVTRCIVFLYTLSIGQYSHVLISSHLWRDNYSSRVRTKYTIERVRWMENPIRSTIMIILPFYRYTHTCTNIMVRSIHCC